MRDHEIELIAALVEGRLEDESKARALIDSSVEHREEYEAQRLAYEALRDAGSATLAESERAALHRDLWTELRSEAAPEARSTPWYYRWVPVTAGLFVVVGLVVALGQIGGGDDASEDTIALADAPRAETTSTAEASADADGGVAEDEAAPGEARSATTFAAEERADAAAEDGSGNSGEVYADEAAMIRQGDFSGGELESVEGSESLTSQVSLCLDRLGIGDYRVVATLQAQAVETSTTTESFTTTTADATSLLVAIPDRADTISIPVAFVDIEGCELVYLDE